MEAMTCSINEAAKALGVSDDIIRCWVNRPKADRLPGFYVSNELDSRGRRPKYRIWVDTLREYAEQQSVL